MSQTCDAMNAVTVTQPGLAVLTQVPIPAVEAGQILVKTKAVTLNPTDWKHRDYVSPPGAILGCDFAGVVTKVGAGVTNLKEGDRVAGAVHGGAYPDTGSFAEYVRTEACLVWPMPNGFTFEEGAALGGVAPATSFYVLYDRLNLPMPDTPLQKSSPFLVWGGATSTGLCAIQLLNMSGFEVIATASPKNFDLVKSYGASAVFSYADPETPAKISAAFPTLALGMDCVSEKGTAALLSKSMGASAIGQKKVVKLWGPEEGDNGGRDVDVSFVMAYSLFGKAYNKFGMDFPAVPDLYERYQAWLAKMPELVKAGLKSNPLWAQEGGLAKVNDGLELLKQGKVSGQKVVFSV